MSSSAISARPLALRLLDWVGLIFERMAAALAIFGGLALIFAMLVTCVSIAIKGTRRFLDFSFSSFIDPDLWHDIDVILGEEELVAFAVGMALFTALPWTMIKRGHVRIDVFERYFGDWFNRVLDFLADASLTLLAYLILTRQWFQIFRKARRNQEPTWDLIWAQDWAALAGRLKSNAETQILGLKEWPFYLFAEFCVAIFFAVGIYCSLVSLIAIFAPSASRRSE